MAQNPIDASLEYQWRSIPQIVAFIKIYDKEHKKREEELTALPNNILLA